MPNWKAAESLLRAAAGVVALCTWGFAQHGRTGAPAGELAVASVSSLFGDVTADGQVDWDDYAEFHSCSRGGPGAAAAGCGGLDADFDFDVDLRDYSTLANVFTAALSSGPCGNGFRNLGEECDDGNTRSGDGCDASCALELPHDRCAFPFPVNDGTRSYDNSGATTDGPSEPAHCLASGDAQVASDLWYCYRAACSGEVTVSLCGSEYDTKLAVYEGCHCPSAEPIACSDDDCGTASNNVQSRVTFAATSGGTYMIRVGSFGAERGAGRLTIGCGLDPCGLATWDCFRASTGGLPGCGEPACCEATCALDQFCCDVTWDDVCAAEAEGVCGGGFSACVPTAGACTATAITPGCSNVACCNAVCLRDPFCCLFEWDSACVQLAGSVCP